MIGEIARLFVSVGAKTTEFDQGMNRVQSRVKAMGQKMQQFGRQMTTFVSLPLIALGAASVKTAMDLEEMEGKFDAVFRDLGDGVRQWAAEHGKAINRSQYDLMGYASTLQDTFVPMGFARDEAAKLSKKMVELGVDLASFNNASEPETIDLLTSAMVGNHEAVRRFGIVLTEARVKEQLLQMGMEDATGSALEQAKMMARLNIIMNSTTDAQGDAARTSGSLTNQIRGLQAAFTDFKKVIGDEFAPTVSKLVVGLTNLLNSFATMDPRLKELVMTLGIALAVFGPLVAVLGTVAVAVTTVAGAVGMAVLPFAGLLAAVFALVAAGVYLWRNWDKVSKQLKQAWDTIAVWGRFVWERLVNIVQQAANRYIWVVLTLVEKVLSAMKRLERFMPETMRRGLDASLEHVKSWRTQVEANIEGLEKNWMASANRLDAGLRRIAQSYADISEKSMLSVQELDKYLKDNDMTIKRAGASYKDAAKDVDEYTTAVTNLARATDEATGDISDPQLFITDKGLVALRQMLQAARAAGAGMQERFTLSALELASKIPGYASGTNFHSGGMAIVGERGPELVNLPRGSSVSPSGGTIEHRHSGSIRVEGVNDQGQLVAVVNQYLSDSILKDQDRYPSLNSGRLAFR